MCRGQTGESGILENATVNREALNAMNLLNHEGIVPVGLLALTTAVGVVAQIPDALPGGAGQVAQLGAVGVLCWLVLKTFPAIQQAISEDRKADREERKADREAYREELKELRSSFKCEAGK